MFAGTWGSKQTVHSLALYLFDKEPTMETRERLETVSYVLDNFSHLLTADERAAVECVVFHISRDKASSHALLRGGGEAGPHILALLSGGQQALRLSCADRLVREHKALIFENACPSCGKLPRTPRARQCLKCGHSWRESLPAAS